MPIASVILAAIFSIPAQTVVPDHQEAPPSFRPGDWMPVTVVAGERGHVRSIRVHDTEPLTFTAESHNFDAIVRVETLDGRILAEDDDSGIVRNAHLVWSPPASGSYHVRVLSKAAFDGLAGLGVLRGALDPVPPFVRDAEEAYWRMAIFRALERDDAGAARMAARCIASSEDGIDSIVAEMVRERQLSRELVRRFKEADGARKRNDFEHVRSVLVDAFAPWGWRARTVVESDAYRNGGELSNAAELLDLELACNTAYLEYLDRIRPAWHRDVMNGRQNLAVTLSRLGKTERALRLDEETLAIAERTRAASDSVVLALKGNMAVKLTYIGDYAGARLLEESVLATLLRTLGPSNERVLQARRNLAYTLDGAGDTEGALTLLEQVLEVREERSPSPGSNLGLRLQIAQLREDHAVIDKLELEALERMQATFPAGHPVLLRVRGEVASRMQANGRVDEARPILEALLEDQLRVLPAAHSTNQATRLDLAWTYQKLDEIEAMDSMLLEYARHAADSLAVAQGLSTREAGAMATGALNEIRYVLGLSRFGSPGTGLDAEIFRWIETRRLVSAPGFRPAATADEAVELRVIRRDARAAQRRFAELLADPSEALVTNGEFAAAARGRDRADRELGRALREQDALVAQVDVPALSRALSVGSAAVGFLRYEGVAFDDGESHRTNEFLAHVVRADGRLFRVELGPSDAIEEAIRDWRGAAGAPIGEASGAAGSFKAAGARLRELILDPVLRVLDGETVLHVCLDGALHLISLDCLPLGDGLVGARLELRTDISFARLLNSKRAPSQAGLLVAMGGLDFDARPSLAVPDPIDAPASAGMSRARASRFRPLRGTLLEVEVIAGPLASTGLEVMALTGERGTKDRLHELAPQARILHLATHGYFNDVPERNDSSEVGTPWGGWSLNSRVDSLLPGAFCGLAFAGANLGRDSLGRLPGIMTAEELASVDLSQCELAVLSACETSAGRRKSGQGIASLQAALHAAGARTAICSLWKVDDSSTQALMLDFYARLTDEHSPRSAADALWEARMKLRSKRLPPSQWAGWVLTGERD
ncbi:MAG: CHAT domain-containing protein/tetratricopeptide (TPR) repeat protein [Chlamydiales bacterium]|jgi:CHAT domain-containing protein/tetratricopeptide (TPR) repeat protein